VVNENHLLDFLQKYDRTLLALLINISKEIKKYTLITGTIKG